MIIRDVGFFEMKKMKKNLSNKIYNDNGRMIKFDVNFCNDLCDHKDIRSSYGINVPQISEISQRQSQIKNTFLPDGVVYYKHVPVGVSYPKYFEDYKDFRSLYKENSKLIIENLKKSIIYNIELIKNNICNTDFLAKNVMYNGEDVQLIDLDGKYIYLYHNQNYEILSRIYQYYLDDMLRIIMKKVETEYTKEEAKEIFKEIRPYFKQVDIRDIYFPLETLENVEKSKVLK